MCEDCIGERASCELMRKLNYSNQDIHVVFIQGKEVPRSILEASETSFDPDRRISKRSRKTNSGNVVNLKVSGSTSVYQLKMMIWESLGVSYLDKSYLIVGFLCFFPTTQFSFMSF